MVYKKVRKLQKQQPTMCFIVELEVRDWPLGNEAPDLVGKDEDGEGHTKAGLQGPGQGDL